MKAGDRVLHPKYGEGRIFEISESLGYADINLKGQKIEFRGRMRNTLIVNIKDLILLKPSSEG